jgi:hypothetical protein
LVVRQNFFFSFTGTRSTMHADSARMGEGSMSQMTVKMWRYHSNDLFCGHPAIMPSHDDASSRTTG